MPESDFFWFGDINEEFIQSLIPAIAKMHKQDKKQEIQLWLRSGGGDLGCAVAFRDFIKAQKIRLTVIGIGEVYSSALVVIGCASTRKATEHCRFLFHNLYYCLDENTQLSSDDCVNISAVLNKSREKMCKMLARDFKQKQSLFWELTSEDHYLTAQEMKRKGLIDAILK